MNSSSYFIDLKHFVIDLSDNRLGANVNNMKSIFIVLEKMTKLEYLGIYLS